MTQPSQEAQNALVDYQLAELNTNMSEVKEQLNRIVPIEVRFETLIKAVEDLTKVVAAQDVRLRELERDKRPLDMAAKVVGVLVLSICGAAAALVWDRAIGPTQARTDAPAQHQTTQQPK